MDNKFDILIIGGGHAGLEAAYAATQFSNLSIGLITLPNVPIASAPCNPSIGGVGKGQVVREIDALGGIMGRLADLAGIQFRTLNESKGYAVQSTRVQIDKEKYSYFAERELGKISNLTIIREKVLRFKNENRGFMVTTEDGHYFCKKMIMTVGTFLNGKLHQGNVQKAGGRMECDNSGSLSSFFGNIKTRSARFKTGTPARLIRDSVDYSKLEEQPSDSNTPNFHYGHKTYDRHIDQVSCYLARTNKLTMDIIRANKEKSPMFNGQITGVGARYCPSIEDKAYRYPEKAEHHIFIEPEGLELDTVYPSGISSSLPTEVQDSFLRSIEGLENCQVKVYGYAVEYDVIDTTQLDYCLSYKGIEGLYFAGQVNGTSGYEEAAAQGLIAGYNAALNLLGQQPLIIDRTESYIGVMVEDLISNHRDEPYRLFTARSENRLYIREDNTINRMHSYRSQLGLNTSVDEHNKRYIQEFNLLVQLLKSIFVDECSDYFGGRFVIPKRICIGDLLKQSELDPIVVLTSYLHYLNLQFSTNVIRTAAITMKYEGYISKASHQYEKLKNLDNRKINWEEIVKSKNISFECKQRIESIKPTSFGQLKLIDGIRPATLAVVAAKAL